MQQYIKIIQQWIKYQTDFEKFLQNLRKQFKLTIKFDIKIIQSILSIINDCFIKNSYNKEFNDILFSCSKFIKFLLTNNFISMRQNQQYKLMIQKIYPLKQLWQNLSYLYSCQNIQQFRQQFFNRILKKQFNDYIQNISEQYIKFWKENILDQNQHTKKVISKLYTIFTKFENTKYYLNKELIKQIQNYIIDLGCQQKIIKINKQLSIIAEQNLFESDQQNQQKLQEIFHYIRQILNKFAGLPKIYDLNLDLRIEKFGSLVNGFGCRDADLDITILTNCYLNEKEFLSYLQKFLNAEMKNFRIKFIKSQNSPSLLEILYTQRKQKSIKIDLLINNCLGVINSKLLYCYSRIKWIKYLGILIKLWGKKFGIISKSYFSSYSLILLLLNYLLEIDKIHLLLDARGRSENSIPNFEFKKCRHQQIESFGVFCNFRTDQQSVTTYKKQDLFELLKGFFFYYSIQGNHWKKQTKDQIISIDGRKSKQFDENRIFTIQDPFDEPHNPGRVRIEQKYKILSSFEQAYNKLKTKNINQIKNIFEN